MVRTGSATAFAVRPANYAAGCRTQWQLIGMHRRRLVAAGEMAKERAWSLVTLIMGGMIGAVAGYVTGKSGR